MEKIYNEVSNDIERCEYKVVMPVSDLNFNKPNNYTTFKLDHGDAFYDPRICFHIQGKLVKKSTEGAYKDDATIKLVHNYPAFLFSRIELKKHNVLIDSIDHVGVTSTIKTLLTRSITEKNSLQTIGFNGGKPGTFEAIGTLGSLGLGFFDYQRYPMYKGGFEITFTRAEDNDAICHWKGTAAGDTEPEDGKIIIENFVLRVPLVEYNQTKKTILVNELNLLSDKEALKYNYYQWQCIEKKSVQGSSCSFDITNYFRNIYNPKFVIIGLQTDRIGDQKKIPGKFDSLDIKNTIVRLNGHRYPEELQNISISNNRYHIMYEQYLKFRRVLFGKDDVLLQEDDFINSYPLMIIDTHLHPKLNSNSKTDIQIDLDFNKAVSGTGTVAYVVVISEAHFVYDIKKNIIRMMM